MQNIKDKKMNKVHMKDLNQVLENSLKPKKIFLVFRFR